jgi:hypothetical protein
MKNQKAMNKVRVMKGTRIGRASAGRANTRGNEKRKKQGRTYDFKGFSMAEIDAACFQFFRSRGMRTYGFSEF